jgi:peroxiredoxin
MKVPDVKFKIREGGEWIERETVDFFGGKRCVIFGLPGAFTPTCTSQQLPSFEVAYPELRNLGITHVYCISVNDSFVMNAWAESLGVTGVEMIPDGNAMFTGLMNMLVTKNNLGFGLRSWRYAAVVDDGVIEKLWEEPGKVDDCEEDPYTTTDPETVIEYLKSLNA